MSKRDVWFELANDIEQLHTKVFSADAHEDVESLRGYLRALYRAYVGACVGAYDWLDELTDEDDIVLQESLGIIEEIPSPGGTLYD